ncbi:MAG: MMPL family transporter [Actinobacteria bacterium]|nr:MMPL family transporter [Actinomycetota bacterium]
MFERLGHLVVRRTKTMLALYFILLAVFAGTGWQVFGELKTSGYDNPKSESSRAAAALAKQFGVRTPLVVASVDTTHGVDTDTPAALALVQRIAAEPGVDAKTSVSYWTSGKPKSLRSTTTINGESRAGMVLIHTNLKGQEASKLAQRLQDKYDGQQDGGLKVYVGGWGPIGNELNSKIASDLAKAESVAIPLSMVALLFAFGSVVAAGLPFMVAAGAVAAAMFFMWLISMATDISVFSINLLTGFGLGLGIDYALLMVNRFREELKRGADSESAVIATIRTAGRTVFVSGLIVAVTLAGLVVFPQYFMKSFAYAGTLVVTFAVITALLALPALLKVLGHRVNKGKLLRGDLAPSDEGRWHDLAVFVMRRPVSVFLVTLIGLGVLAAPALSANFSQIDARALPASNPVAQASAFTTENFNAQESSPIDIFLTGGGNEKSANDLGAWGCAIATKPHVLRVTTPDYILNSQPPSQPGKPVKCALLGQNANLSSFISGKDARVTVITDVPERSAEAAALVKSIRALVPPVKGEVLVGGASAVFVDSQAAITDNLPFLLLWLGIAILVILFLFTGSVVLPIKAVLLNLLSLGATLGVLTFIFQGGHLTWLVGSFTPTKTIDTNSIVLIAVVAFGLSMDYEVFLLARIKEEHDRGADTTTSVALGLQRSARIVTTAAVLLAVVFASFISSGITNIKLLGFGVAFAILLDATVVRALLVPALMKLMGSANWWAPKPLAMLHERIGMKD